MSIRVFDELLNKQLLRVENKDNEELLFIFTSDEKYKFYHAQECCESVYIAEIIGDLEDLSNTSLVEAEEASSVGIETDYESYTWTFYKFRSDKGTVVVRWLGSSNGYYSERVDFDKVAEDE